MQDRTSQHGHRSDQHTTEPPPSHSEVTDETASGRLLINHNALVMRVVDIEHRLAAIENTARVTTRTLHFLVDSELAGLAADFTPEQVAEVREAARAEAERITAEIAGRQVAER